MVRATRGGKVPKIKRNQPTQTNTKAIKKLLIDKEIKIKDIAMATGVSNSTVCQTVYGRRRNRRVTGYLVNVVGCPPRWFPVDVLEDLSITTAGVIERQLQNVRPFISSMDGLQLERRIR